MRQPSLVLQFGALSFVLVTLLGAVVGWQLSSVITERAQANAQASGELNVQLALGSFFTSLPSTIGPATSGQSSTGSALLNSPVVRKQILSATATAPNGLILFSTKGSLVGTTTTITDLTRETFKGASSAHLATSAVVATDHLDRRLLLGDDRVLVVDMPLSLSITGTPDIAVELTMPYAPTAAAIRKDTNRLYLWLAGGSLLLYLSLFRLVASASRRLRHQSQANRTMALHDTLTGLANRSLLRDRVDQAITVARRRDRRVALLLLDLDRFKEINDTLGHHHGDELLRMVGPRLRSVLRDEDTVARLGGDEFVVLLPDAGDLVGAGQVAQKLLQVFGDSFDVENISLDVGVSIGIAVTPDHGDDFETLLQHADVAMYAAKASQLGLQIYDPEQDANTLQRLALLGELRRGVDQGQLLLHYQPKADLTTGAVTSVEALVRWQHPTLGLLAPGEFIPLAEHTGLIRPLTLVVLDQALAQARVWADAGRPLAVAVNISARCLLDLEFCEEVEQALARHGLPATALELEITESTVMLDPARALLVLQSLSMLGVTLSIDDFGTGYSSMAYLQRLPVHELKIDRSFIAHLSDETNAAIVASSIDLGKNLGLRVIAEGVEDEDTWRRLVALGCHAAQGYYLSRPVPAEQFDAWVLNRPPVPSSMPVH